MVHLGSNRVLRGCPTFNSSNQKPIHHARPTVFKRLQWPAVSKAFKPDFKGILAPVPFVRHFSNQRHYGSVHYQGIPRHQGPTCQSYGNPGHHSIGCCFTPRSSHLLSIPAGDAALFAGDPLLHVPLPSGPATGYKNIHFSSFSDYSKRSLGLSPRPLLIVPWSCT